MPANFKSFFNSLKMLPAITFALMLGAGVTLTAMSTWLVTILAYHKWPDSVAEARVNNLGLALCICLGLIGLVIIALAFGKIKNLSFTGPNSIGGSVAFDDEEDQPKAE
jgi:hypothetical protein